MQLKQTVPVILLLPGFYYHIGDRCPACAGPHNGADFQLISWSNHSLCLSRTDDDVECTQLSPTIIPETRSLAEQLRLWGLDIVSGDVSFRLPNSEGTFTPDMIVHRRARSEHNRAGAPGTPWTNACGRGAASGRNDWGAVPWS